MKKQFFIVAAVIISSQLQAQPVPVLRGDTTGKVLDEVILTANKFEQKQSTTGKVVTVVSREQLERSSGKTLNEILNTVAGTTIIGANNNFGTNQTVSIRGSSAGNVLILIDGIPVNDPSVITNYFDLNLISTDQVERIEILKGGQSTLYGSDAVAGVINIIPKKTGTKTFSLTGSLSGGSYNTFKENIGLQARKNSISYLIGYTHLGSEGFSAAYDKNKAGSFDKDGYNQHVVNGKLNIALNKKVQIYFAGTYSFYKAALDAAAYSDEKDYTAKNKNGQAGTGLSFIHKTGSFHFNYNFNYVSRHYIDDSLFKGNPYVDYSENRFIGRTHFAEIYNNWKWRYFELLAGADYRFNNTNQYSLYVFPGFPAPPSILKAKMSQVSPYVSVIFKTVGGFTAEIGGRWNHHSEYGNNFSFTFNPSLLVHGRVKIFANLYSAYKTPTLYQLFDPSAGNTKLEPEKGIISEAGVEIFSTKQFHARLVGFYRSTKNAIQYILTDPVFFTAQYRNISEQKNYGAELETGYKTGRWDITFNYTYTDGKTKSGYDGTGGPLGKDTTYYNLYRIPKNAVNFAMGYCVSRGLFIQGRLRTVGKREEFIYGTFPETQKGYTTVDLYGEYFFSKKIKAFIDLKNITNTEYFDIPGYNSRKFNFMTGLNFNL